MVKICGAVNLAGVMCSWEPHVTDWHSWSPAEIPASDWTVWACCGAPGSGGHRINCPNEPQSLAEAIDHMREAERALRPGSQPLPVPNDSASMHDLVIRDIASRPVAWDLSYGKASRIRDQVCEDLLARKQLGLDRYGSILQARNGRDALRDLYEECMDGAVYARQALIELPEDGLAWSVIAEVYDELVTALVRVRRARNAATE